MDDVRPQAPAGERRLSAEAQEQYARDVAWRLVNRRDRTVSEMRSKLTDKRVEPELIERVVDELIQAGYLDDASYAQRFAEDRRRLDAWGADRIERRLRDLGVDGEYIASALGAQSSEEELAAALQLLERRFPEGLSTPRERDRALGVLLRRGYGIELAYDALRRHAGVTEEA